jgi:chorismate dehydratase
MLVVPEKSLPQHHDGALPRLGQINFVNSLPVVLPMMESEWQAKAEVTYATPAALNEAFERNELDVGAMSSFYFLQNGTLRLVEDLSISSDGAVASVMCYSKIPLSRLDGARIAVPTSSATSINLLLVLLREIFGAVPQLTACHEPTLSNGDFDAALVIGDQALAAETAWDKQFVHADLGEWWRINTGLPMVFGLWAAREAWVLDHPESFAAICQHLKEAAASGLTDKFAAVLAEGCRRTGMSEARIKKYFTQDLNYRMSERHQEALQLYGKLCRKHGLFAAGA